MKFNKTRAATQTPFPTVSGFLTLLVLAAFLMLGRGAAANTDPFADSNVYGNYLNGLYAEQLHNYPKAAAFLDAALAQDPDNDTLRHKALRANIRAGRMDRALELAEALDADNGTLPAMVDIMLGLKALKAGDWAAADSRLQSVRAGRLEQMILPLMQAWAQAGTGDTAAAVKSLDEIRDPFFGVTALMEGLLHKQAGDLDKAEKALMVRVDDPLEAPGLILRALVRVRLARGDLQGARELLSQYVARFPNQTELDADMTQLMRDKTLDPLADSPATAVGEGLYQMAIPFAKQSWAITMDLMQVALWLKPDMDKARIFIGNLLEQKQRFEEALTYYQAVPEASPYRWQARILSAGSQYDLKNVDTAIDSLQAMAVERPGLIGALETLAQIYHAENDYAKMDESYDRLINRLSAEREEHWRYYYLRGMARERQKKWEEAEPDFLKALELKPDQPEVLNYLGYSWVDMGRNLERAQDMLKRAVEQRYTGFIIDSLGWAYFKLGKYDDAVKQLERAVNLEPMEAVINDHLGDAYWRVGREREARYQWERAMGIESEEVDPDAIRRKLEEGLQPAE